MSVARDQLKSIVERVERLHEERKAIADDIRDIYAEAKGNGFNTNAIKAVVKHRAADPAKREELEADTLLYLQSLGEIPDFEPQTGTNLATHDAHRAGGTVQ